MCLNDFAVLADGRDYHVLHLQGPWTPRFDERAMETSYGHARSTDLVTWEALGPCFGVGAPGRFDESAIWTMQPFAHAGGTAMVYTGVTARPWAEQAVGLAYSDRGDGTGWRRVSGDAVVRADPRWYRTESGMAWRDPFVVPDGPGWAMVVCASDRDLPSGSAGCVGFATSDDLVRWEVQPPVLVPGDVDEFECPVLERTADGWLLLGSIGATHRVEAWRSDRLDGGWERVGPIGPAGPYAPRLVDGPDGSRLLLHTVQRRVGLSDSGALCRGMLAQPKVFDAEAACLRWWDGTDRHFSAGFEEIGGNGVADVPVDDAGLVVLREDRFGARLTLTFDATRVALVRSGSVVQEHRWATPARTLRVLLVGEYVEVFADGVLVLATADYGPAPAVLRLITGSRTGVVGVRGLLLADDRDDASALRPRALPAGWPFALAPAT